MNSNGGASFAVLDACFLVGYCAKEKDKYRVVMERLSEYARENRALYIPGVAIGEVIWTICRLREEGAIDVAVRDLSLLSFREFCKQLHNSPDGDLALVGRTIEIRTPYGPNRSYDAVYIALAERLTERGDTVFSTFDVRAEKQAQAMAPTVKVELLVPRKSMAGET
jgi:predicted nucleic acid-binding protein